MFWMIGGAILIGITLGLMGSGGSILTVPVLVYFLGHEKNLAVAESMAIVGIIALVAAIPYVYSKQVDWKSVWFFGIPGMLGTFLGAWLGARYFSGSAKLLLFALVMIASAYTMFVSKKKEGPEGEGSKSSGGNGKHYGFRKLTKISLEGTVVGTITGIVGVGGGFLIVPALVLLGGLSMRLAVGTSLLIIAMKCVVGFAEYQYEFLQQEMSVDFQTIVIFAVLGTIGSFVGRLISNAVNQDTLRKAFAVLLVVMAIFILAKEAPAVFASAQPGTETVSKHVDGRDRPGFFEGGCLV